MDKYLSLFVCYIARDFGRDQPIKRQSIANCVFLSVRLSCINFSLRHMLSLNREREDLTLEFCMHTHTKAISNDIKINDLDHYAKYNFSDLLAIDTIVFHKHSMFYMYLFDLLNMFLLPETSYKWCYCKKV